MVKSIRAPISSFCAPSKKRLPNPKRELKTFPGQEMFETYYFTTYKFKYDNFY